MRFGLNNLKTHRQWPERWIRFSRIALVCFPGPLANFVPIPHICPLSTLPHSTQFKSGRMGSLTKANSFDAFKSPTLPKMRQLLRAIVVPPRHQKTGKKKDTDAFKGTYGNIWSASAVTDGTKPNRTKQNQIKVM